MKSERYYRGLIWLLAVIVILLATRGLILFPRDPDTLLVTTLAGHEWEYNLWRILGMSSALHDGMPGRWLEGFSHGWGYPLYHYTGPLPYTLGGLLYLGGFEIHTALNICWWLAYAGSGFAMFWAMRRIFGGWGALLATTCYLFAPYHLVDTFVRTNLVETTAFVFPPLIVYGLWKLRYNRLRGILVGAVGIGLIPLTHILSTYLIGLALIVFSVTYVALLPLREKLPFIRDAACMAALGLGLSAFFWVPAVADVPAVKGFDAMVEGFYSYKNHFVYPQQLISNYWGYGGSDPGPNDFMSFSMGRITLGCVALTLLLAIYHLIRIWRRHRANAGFVVGRDDEELDQLAKLRFTLACLAAGLFSTYMAVYYSAYLWEVIPRVEVAQFPWRFLFPATFFLCVTLAGLPNLLRHATPWGYGISAPLVTLACVAVIVTHWDFARAGAYMNSETGRLTRAEYVDFGLWTTNQYEFLPVTSRIPWREAKREVDTEFLSPTMAREDRVLNSEVKNGFARVQLRPGAAGTLVLDQHWHPAWKASANGKPITTYAFDSHPFGPVAVDLPADTLEVEFRYGYTPAGRIGMLVSLTLILVGVVLLLVFDRRRDLQKVGPVAGLIAALVVFYWVTANPVTLSLEERIDAVGTDIDAENYADAVVTGTRWDKDGTAIFDSSGLRVNFTERRYDNQVQVSLDSNERYLAVLQNRGEEVAREVIPKRPFGGLSPYTFEVGADAVASGYDSLVLFPIAGDGFYSLGHVLTRSADSLPEQKVTAEAEPSLPKEVALADMDHRVRRGSTWDAEGNVVFNMAGVDVLLGSEHRDRRLDLALDSNDHYLMAFLKDSELVGLSHFSPYPGYRGGGMNIYHLAAPESAVNAGYDRVRLVPMIGDGFFSLGHFILRP